MSMVKVAAVQMRSDGDMSANITALERMVGEAAAQGAQYVQTPENTGIIQNDRALYRASLHAEQDDPVVKAAGLLAKRYGIYLHIGSTPIKLDNGLIANRAFVFAPDGSKITTYDKIHMFDVDLDNGESWRESDTISAGDRAVVAELPFMKLGLAICYDIRFPQLFQAQANAGANVISAPAAFTRQTGEAHWHILQRARAIENGAFLISAAQGGLHNGNRQTYGHSIIVSPWGKVLAEADHDDPAVIYAEIDVADSTAARNKIPNLKNAREFKLEIIGGGTDKA
ncbi:carbon-nitrogen hydrolase family protein [Bacillus subtilis]|uniref:carbon-nitrogen hydrolase family protein n=1 Tax=Pseudochrobactrum asaccharolyticum TaxID=354351 RepID=UPI001F1DE0B7|nr:carbon-nitrogen hydrolase family protein [Pseudochrobactrum asaccharolyticum]MCF7646299.1 carbon-nitrogen hydrolase family protein [Pseudochrobactrum asaccharolyticum]MCF7673046.1 carbon-nitrogen hydrolase family protein [Bacillus subtilis]